MDRKDIVNQILDNSRIMRQSMHGYFQNLSKQLPVSRSQLELLFVLRQLQPVHSKQLAQQLDLTPGAVSQLLDNLFGQSLITRTTDPNDRRLQSLQLTKKGETMIVGLEKQRHELMERLITELQTDELAIWLRVQQKMIEQFKAHQINSQKKETT